MALRAVARTGLCPCTSGKKYKHCHANEHPSGETHKVYFDDVRKSFYLINQQMLYNTLDADGQNISRSFDNLYLSELKEIGKLHSQGMALFFSGLNQDSELNTAICGLLFNASSTLCASTQVLRTGYALQSGALMRNFTENIYSIFHLLQHPQDLAAMKKGKFDTGVAITTTSKLFPLFGRIYGFLTKEFSHIGRLYLDVIPFGPYEKRDEAHLDTHLVIIRIGAWLFYIAAEAAFIKHASPARYWKVAGPHGKFQYAPSPSETLWLESYLRLPKV